MDIDGKGGPFNMNLYIKSMYICSFSITQILDYDKTHLCYCIDGANFSVWILARYRTIFHTEIFHGPETKSKMKFSSDIHRQRIKTELMK